MPRAQYPDVLVIWDISWTHTKGRRGWLGPRISDPEDPMLAISVEYQRIVRKDGYYLMLDPGITLDRFGWTDGDIRIRYPDAEDADG